MYQHFYTRAIRLVMPSLSIVVKGGESMDGQVWVDGTTLVLEQQELPLVRSLRFEPVVI